MPHRHGALGLIPKLNCGEGIAEAEEAESEHGGQIPAVPTLGKLKRMNPCSGAESKVWSQNRACAGLPQPHDQGGPIEDYFRLPPHLERSLVANRLCS